MKIRGVMGVCGENFAMNEQGCCEMGLVYIYMGQISTLGRGIDAAVFPLFLAEGLQLNEFIIATTKPQ